MSSNGPVLKSPNFLDPEPPPHIRDLKRKSEVNFRDTLVTFNGNGNVSTGLTPSLAQRVGASLRPPPPTSSLRLPSSTSSSGPSPSLSSTLQPHTVSSTFSCPLQTDRLSSNTLSSIWDIEVDPSVNCTIVTTKETKIQEKKAPLVKFRRSPPTNGRRPSLKHCSKLKARDISSCEISICDTVNPFDSTSSLCPKKHTSVSFGSLPTSNNSDDGEDGEDEENDKIHVLVEDGHPEHQNQSSSSLSRPRPSLVIQQSTDSADTGTTSDTNQGTGRRDTSQMPIATALFVATCLGTPAIALTGLKLGMFAAVGGGIMGFATGKMFAEHEERQAMIKGDFNDGRMPTHLKRQKTMKRIQEWERFEESCHMIKEMDNEQIEKISELQKERRVRTGSVGVLRKV